MIAVIMKIPGNSDPARDELFQRFIKTPGLIHAYQLDNDAGGATVTIWESHAARDAYMASTLRSDVDTALPGLTREVFTVRASK